MADRWVDGKATTRRTRARKVISRFLPFWRKRENTSGASCATEIDRRASRSHAIWRVYLPLCRDAWERSSPERTLAFIVGRRSKPTRKGRSRSSWWRAKHRVYLRGCKSHVGGTVPSP